MWRIVLSRDSLFWADGMIATIRPTVQERRFTRCLGSVCLLLVIVTSLFEDSASLAQPDPDPWRLVWSDEFDYTGLPDAAKWGYDVGSHGWGNKELQNYTARRKENACVVDGRLIIEARRDGSGAQKYTSA